MRPGQRRLHFALAIRRGPWHERPAMTILRIALCSCLVVPLACTSKATMPDAIAASATVPVVEEGSLDRSADPCDDFYQFACGGWLKANPIPPDRSSWGRSFAEIDKRNQERIRTLLDAAAAGTSKDPDAQKLGDIYATCLDEEKAETESPKALQIVLARIAAVRDLPSLGREVGRLHAEGTGVFFALDQQQDAKDARQVIGYAHQGGLGLPDRDFYLKDDEKTARIRGLYLEHVGKLLELSGVPKEASAAQAKSVVAIETALAKVSLTRVEARDPQKTYHRLDRAGLARLAPKFEWDAYFSALEHEKLQAINVESPVYFEGLNAVLATAQADALRTYLRWHAVNNASSKLGKAYVEENFRYSAITFSGAKQDLPRWKKCAAFTTAAMGQAVGRLFVEGAFSPEAKEISIDMIKQIEDAFEAQIGAITWMDEPTKIQAREKMHKIANQIGYPNQWLDYSALEPARDSYLANALRASRFQKKRVLDKIGKPLDREDWEWPPSSRRATRIWPMRCARRGSRRSACSTRSESPSTAKTGSGRPRS